MLTVIAARYLTHSLITIMQCRFIAAILVSYCTFPTPPKKYASIDSTSFLVALTTFAAPVPLPEADLAARVPVAEPVSPIFPLCWP